MAIPTASLVHDLTDDTFENFVEQHELVVVGFVLPWLPNFERFSREYTEAARTWNLQTPDVRFAQVNCTKEERVYELFRFNRWPTIRLFRGLSSTKQYEGAWKTCDIVSWLMGQCLPVISTITTTSLQDLRSNCNVVVVGYFAGDDQASHAAFRAVAEAMHEDYVFGIADDDDLMKNEGIEFPAITLYKKFGEAAKDAMNLTHDSQGIAAFVKAMGTPLIFEFHPEVHQTYVETGIPLAYILTNNTEERAQLQRVLAPLAKTHRGQILFGTVDVNVFDSIAEDLHLEVDKWPAFAIKDAAKGQRFPLNQMEELSAESISSFVKNFLDGTLKPTIKSEPVPETQDGPVMIIVGHNYDEIVIQNDKDVLVDYYTQWCGPCKSMAPTYEKLAGLYASHPCSKDLVTVAKVDWEANDIPGDIRGFPTFQLFPAGSKDSPVYYDGPWTVEGFADFIRDEGKHKIDILSNSTNRGEEKLIEGESENKSHS